MDLQPLAVADAPALWALDQRCFPPGIAYSQAEIRALLRQAERGFHRAVHREQVLAGFLLSLSHRNRGHVITIDVDDRHRRRGVGQALMEAAERHYHQQGAAGMRLEVAVNNLAALRFYGRLGYRVVRPLPGYYARDLDGILLHKDWPAPTLHPPLSTPPTGGPQSPAPTSAPNAGRR